MLMKRFYLIEKAKDVDIIGILVGTLSVSKYLDMIDHLKDIITKAGKRYYMFVVGKLNVPKLANFQEIEMFVVVACPENSLIDSKDLYIPVVTPHELEIALVRGKEWTNSYTTDFQKVLAEQTEEPQIAPPGASDEESSETRVSLVSNKIKVNHKVLSSADANSTSMELTVRNENNSLITTTTPSATSFFLNRSYQGLQQRLGETPVVDAVEGRGGVPLQYDGEIED
jgi:diphthamide biosynthesis protein 2